MSELNGVSCPSVKLCVAVGRFFDGKQQAALVERWAGGKWSIQSTPIPSGPSGSGHWEANLNGVSCVSRNACTAVGFIYHNTAGVFSFAALAEHWNGSKWSTERLPSLGGDELDGISCPLARACAAVGFSLYRNRDVTLAERWNGSKWSITRTPNPPGAVDSYLGGVSCPSQGSCTAAGGFSQTCANMPGDYVAHCKPLVEHWNGKEWSIQPAPVPAGANEGSQFFATSCPSATACTAVGNDFNSSSNGPNQLTLAEGSAG